MLLGLSRSMKDLSSPGIDGNEISRNVDKVIISNNTKATIY